MFLIYKIVIVVLTLSVLFYYFSVPCVYLYIISVIVVHNEEKFHCFLWNCISNFCLKVRFPKSKVKLFSHSTAYSKHQHPTPSMQISYMNTTKSAYSPSHNSDNRTRFFNGVTSTPLSSPTSRIQNSLFLPNKLSPLRSPPMYSLSEVSSSSNKSPKPIQNISGPLLASTRFNVSLGTYTDTKSPGLTNRIVQYSNEAKQKQTPTHQIKYGSPGLFPVVHFFKQDIPTISPKQRKVTVKIASPDTSWYNSPSFAANKISSRSPSLQNGHDIPQSNTDAETRSVLDALKEISRKRINTTTDFETEQDACKRQKRCEKNLTPENNKRAREESPVAESSNKNSIQPSAKKVCVVDLVAASFTSSQLFQEQLHKGLNKTVELENVETMTNKPSHLLTVSTQTTEVKITKIKDAAEQTDAKETDVQIVEESKSPKSKKQDDGLRYANIFDPTKLEINRKNKLAMLLSAVTGDAPAIIPYEKPKMPSLSEELSSNNMSAPSTPKLVSILSPQNKPKHGKHVTFNLPSEENESSEAVLVTTKEATASESSVSISSAISMSTPTKESSSSLSAIKDIETPKSVLSTPTVTKLNFGISDTSVISKDEEKKVDMASKTEEKDASKTEAIGFAFKSSSLQTSTTTSMPTFSFGIQSTMTTTASSNISSFSTPQTFSPPKDTSVSPKSGGFKFDLTKSTNEEKITSNRTPSTSASISSDTSKQLFGTNQITTGTTSEIKSPNSNMFKAPQALAPAIPTFSFGTDKSTTNTPSNINTVPAFTPPIFSASSTDNITKTTVTSSTVAHFGSIPQDLNVANSNKNQIDSTPITTSQSATSTFASSNTLNFGPPYSGQNSTSNVFPAPPVSNSAFGAQSSAISPFGIQSTNLATSSTFGAVPTIQTTNSVFGSIPSSNIPSFGLNNFSNTTSIAPTTTATPTFSNAQGFGKPVTTSINATAFGAPKTTPAFGTSSGPGTMFGSTTSSPFTSTPGFGSSTTGLQPFSSPTPADKSFNANTTSSSIFVTNPANQTFNTSTTSSGGFGASLGNKPFTFGPNNNNNNATFNAPNATPSFNFTATTSSNTTFTSKSIPSFGATFTSNAFGSSTVQSPSTTSTSGIFKSPTTFGNPQFGSKPENTFGTKSENNGFGAKPENNAFGLKPDASTFGAKPETSTFGTKPENNTFGTFSSTFGSSNNTPAFGSNTSTANTFGTNANANTFGTTNNPGTFGATNSSAFGQTPNSSGFGTNPGTSSTFGATANINTFGTTPNIGGNFGASSNNTTMFGATANATNNTFGANTNNNAFGSGTAFGGSSTTAPAFGFNSGDNSSAFSKPQPSTGGFGSVGSGDTTFQFAGNTGQGFGAGNTTVTTSTGPSSVFAFGPTNATSTTPATGVFTFGSADSKPFNFNAGSNPNPVFGSGTPGFNTGSPQAFNPTSSQYGGAGVFNIGSGSSSGNRSRMQQKNKRRT